MSYEDDIVVSCNHIVNLMMDETLLSAQKHANVEDEHNFKSEDASKDDFVQYAERVYRSLKSDDLYWCFSDNYAKLKTQHLLGSSSQAYDVLPLEACHSCPKVLKRQFGSVPTYQILEHPQHVLCSMDISVLDNTT